MPNHNYFMGFAASARNSYHHTPPSRYHRLGEKLEERHMTTTELDNGRAVLRDPEQSA